MSREIKFRAWDSELKFFVDQAAYFVELDGSAWFNLWTGEGGDNLIDQSSKLFLEQFTGITDKNGKEIYEGDILSISFGIPPTTANLEIAWNEYGWYMKGKHCSDYLKESYRDDLEKIGNIHEHSHLLD